MPRMKILNKLEREAFESPPHFNSAERKRFFSLPKALNGIVEGLRTPANKVFFIVMAGYFRASRKFFAKQFRPPDVEFVPAPDISGCSWSISASVPSTQKPEASSPRKSRPWCASK